MALPELPGSERLSQQLSEEITAQKDAVLEILGSDNIEAESFELQFANAIRILGDSPQISEISSLEDLTSRISAGTFATNGSRYQDPMLYIDQEIPVIWANQQELNQLGSCLEDNTDARMFVSSLAHIIKLGDINYLKARSAELQAKLTELQGNPDSEEAKEARDHGSFIGQDENSLNRFIGLIGSTIPVLRGDENEG